MKVGHRNIKPCCKLPCYSRILNYRTCKIIFSSQIFHTYNPYWVLYDYYYGSIFSPVHLFWTVRFIILSISFQTVSINQKQKHEICYCLWGCEVPHNLKENDIHYSVMIPKSVSPGYHFNKNTLLQKVIFVFLPTGLVLLNELFSNRMQRCINSSLMTGA